MTPKYAIVVGEERDLTSTIADKLKKLSVQDKVGISADTADIELFFDGSFAIPRPGITLEIKIGYEEARLWSVGKFIVAETTLSGPPDTLRIRGTSLPQSPQAAVEALQGTTERVWQSYEINRTTFEDIVNEVCTDAKLTTKIAPELAKIEMPFTAQIGESDAEFLIRITGLRNGIIKYHDTQVIFERKDSEKLGTLNIDFTECTQWSFTHSERTQFSSVTAKYQVTEEGKVQVYTAGKGKPHKVIRSTFPDRGTAVSAADSVLKNLKRSTIKASVTLPTIPGLLAETKISLTGFPDASLNREYIVEAVTHTLSREGLTSQCSAKQSA